MTEQTKQPATVRRAKPKPQPTGIHALWRRIRTPLAQSTFVKAATVSLLTQFLRLIRLTTRPAEGSVETIGKYAASEPMILALWHGQHLMAPIAYPSKRPLVAMVSRSADAELNAQVIEKFGIEAVRGSGGRESRTRMDKGGARALVALKKALDAGKNVCMIADIPHGTPRQSGQGIILLASLSGRPILPVAVTTSRRKVIEKSWDKTTINLPFGRRAVAVGEPIHVSAKIGADELEEKRVALTSALNEATQRAYSMVDGTA